MPAYIAPIETTRSYSVQPAKGLRYGNFEGVVHLPPVIKTTKLGEHSFSTLNNQQIYKTVCEWFEGWRAWQQRVLLCGIVDRCTLRQVDILATTLEPIKHRDYTVAVKHRYPTTPLKKIRDDPSKKKRKKKKLRKKKVVKKEIEAHDLTLSSEQTLDDMLDMEGGETPESVIISIPNFVTREGEKLLEEKLNILKQSKLKLDKKLVKEQYEKLDKVKTDKLGQKADVNEDYDTKVEDKFETVDDFAGALAEKIIDDTLSFTVTEQDSLTSSYAQNLAGAILTQAMDNVGDIMTEKEKLFEKKMIDSNTHEAETAIKNSTVDNNTRRSSKIKDKEKIVSSHTQDYDKSLVKSGRRTTSPAKSYGKQVDFRSPFLTARERSPDRETSIMQDPVRLDKSECPTSLVRILSPKEQTDAKGENSKRIQSGHSGVSRSLSAVTRSSISKMRYELFGSNLAVSTPDFFRKNDVSRYGTMQRELRLGDVHRPSRLQNIPVPVTRIYKSVKWWPEAPGDGRIFFQAHHEELNTNFRDQLQKVWDWMELWEDYEKIALLKELLKLCGPENLGFIASHIQQQLRDARDMNRLSDKLLLYIFSFLAADEINLISQVSRRWRFLCARDDLWMIKCHELGLEEGIKNLETMILKSSSRQMGIDWHLAYEELRRITQMMKMGFAKGKKRRGAAKDKAVDFKAEMEQLKKKVTDATPEFSESFSESSIESFHPTFEFRNQVTAHADAPGGSLTREQLHNILKRILFEPEGTDCEQ